MIEINPVDLFALAILALLSYLDIKSKSVPTIITTSTIFILALVNFNNLNFGILGFILGWLLFETFDEKNAFFSGVADLKATIMVSLFANTLGEFLLITILILIYGVAYKIIMKKMFKQTETAFLPVFFMTLLTIIILRQI